MKILKPLIKLVIALLLTGTIKPVKAQLPLVVSLAQKQQKTTFDPIPTFRASRIFTQSDSTLLKPAKIDPDPGYLSFLCRKELEIERSLPVGFWFQAGEPNAPLRQKAGTGATTSFQLKLLRF